MDKHQVDIIGIKQFETLFYSTLGIVWLAQIFAEGKYPPF